MVLGDEPPLSHHREVVQHAPSVAITKQERERHLPQPELHERVPLTYMDEPVVHDVQRQPLQLEER